ncbi:hypothetical protein GGI07_001013 [Coemansia sp. Benny D115]|nr:hypothetical protein GGI07_001013 [Coemansia sp. Benny D115]
MRPGVVHVQAKDVVWRITNFAVAALWIAVAVYHFIDGSFQSVMPGIFLLFIGSLSIVFEFWRPVEVLKNCYFLWNFMGRGISNILVSILMIVSAIVFFVWADFMRIMLGIYEIVFGVWMIMFELAELAWLTPYVQFMFTWRGRGFFYIFIGCLTLGHKALGWIFGAIITAIGVLYVVLSFTAKKNESYATDVHSAGNNMYNDSGMHGSQKGMYGGQGMYGGDQGMGGQYAGGGVYSGQNTYSSAHPNMQYGGQNTYPSQQGAAPYGTQTTYTDQGNSNGSGYDQSSPTDPTHSYAPHTTDHLHTPM